MTTALHFSDLLVIDCFSDSSVETRIETIGFDEEIIFGV
jgi:hypothetical protein